MKQISDILTEIPLDNNLEQEVLVVLKFPNNKFDNEKALDAVFELEEILMKIVERENLGRLDGNEFCQSSEEETVTFFIYGPNADKIHKVISPILSSLPRLPGSYILKRNDTSCSNEKKIFLDE